MDYTFVFCCIGCLLLVVVVLVVFLLTRKGESDKETEEESQQKVQDRGVSLDSDPSIAAQSTVPALSEQIKVNASMTLISVSLKGYSPTIKIINELYDPLMSVFASGSGNQRTTVDKMELTDKPKGDPYSKNPWMEATHKNIIDRLSSLADTANRRPNEKFFHLIHYSGYSMQESTDDPSETDNMNEHIYVSGRNGKSQTTIRDDTLRLVLQQFRENSTILFVFDCRMALTMLDFRFAYYVNENGRGALLPAKEKERTKIPPTPLRCKVFSLFGTTDNEEPGELIKTLNRIRLATPTMGTTGPDILRLFGLKDLLVSYKGLTNQKNDNPKNPRQGVSFEGNMFDGLFENKPRSGNIQYIKLFDFRSLVDTII